MNKKQLKQGLLGAAQAIEQLQGQLKKAHAQLTEQRALAKKASAPAAPSPEVVQLAKKAADALYERGQIATEARRDQFAAAILDPQKALTALTKLASSASAPKVGTVVSPDAPTTKSADEVWGSHIAGYL